FAGALAGTLVVSLAIGGLHAVLIHFLRMPPFIVTLGSLSILRSVSQLMSNAMAIPVTTEGLSSAGFDWLANGRVVGIPVSAWLLVILLVVLELFMRRGRMGRALDRKSTRLNSSHL